VSSLNSLSSNTLVHLVFEQNGKRFWFNRTDRKYDAATGVWMTIPVIGSEPRESNPVTLEMAVVCQRRWRETGIECRIAKEANGPYIDDPDPKNDQVLARPHKDVFITVDEQGNLFDSLDAPCVYLVRAVNTVNGPMFCLRFENPILQHQAQFSSLEEGPEVAVQRAIGRGYTKFELPKPNPYLEARRQEAQRAGEHATNARFTNLRPGDRDR
jgi:hypothetical protein